MGEYTNFDLKILDIQKLSHWNVGRGRLFLPVKLAFGGEFRQAYLTLTG